MRSFQPVKKILWATDPFEEDTVLRKRTAELFLSLTLQTGAEGELAYVFSPAELNLLADYSVTSVEQYFPAAVQALEEFSSGLSPDRKFGCQVISNFSSASRHATEALCGYAKNSGADLILVGSHQRHGLSRLLLGSFAETLSLHCPIPLLVNGTSEKAVASIKSAEPIRSILFPTDFSEESRVAFEYVVDLASRLRASLTVFHCLQRPVEPVVQSGIYLLGGGWVPMHFDFSEVNAHARDELKRWCADARSFGIHVEERLEEQEVNAADAIMAAVDQLGIDLLLMASQSGPISTFLLGSLTRQMTRRTTCPIWIVHPQNLLQKQAKAA